jgi:hypothetical protein
VKRKEPPVDHSPIIGMAIMRVAPCRCECSTTKLDFYSSRSKKLIERCLWCNRRRGAPSDDEINKVTEFVNIYGWNVRPLALCDDGSVRCAY